MANLDSASASAAQQADTKPCPNCGKGLVPKSEPDSPPWFGPPPRLPKDNETVLSSSDFLNTGKRALGKGANARVFIQSWKCSTDKQRNTWEQCVQCVDILAHKNRIPKKTTNCTWDNTERKK
jgi:ribosomal protein S27AE